MHKQISEVRVHRVLVHKVLVLGMGKTGYSIVRYLTRCKGAARIALGVQISIADSRQFPPYLAKIKDEFPEVEIITAEIPINRFDDFDEVVTSPGVELPRLFKQCRPASSRACPIGDVELFARNRACQSTAPIIGITGSNGKSTVTMLVQAMLIAQGKKVATGGNIGTPALDLLQLEAPDYYVLELSSFQLETTSSLDLVAATILNISEDHLDRYDDMNQYAAAKVRIFKHAQVRVVNRDDEGIKQLGAAQRVCSFGLETPAGDNDFGTAMQDGVRVLMKGLTALVKADDLTLKGEQNISNVLAAFALIHAAGVELDYAAIQAASKFSGLPHRCEFVTEASGVTWINDSKGTNVGATVAAISGICVVPRSASKRESQIVLIAGGKGKGADFAPLAKVVNQAVSHTILFGEDADMIAADIAAERATLGVTLVGSLQEAVLEAKTRSDAPGINVVLFSPACASFDMFDHYAHRGNAFKKCVLELVS